MLSVSVESDTALNQRHSSSTGLSRLNAVLGHLCTGVQLRNALRYRPGLLLVQL